MSGPDLAIIEVTDLRVERGHAVILDGISWRVESGQHWVILGANGSGKTSMLKSLTGYLMPTSGGITVLGERFGASDWRQLRLHIGIVSSAVNQMISEGEPTQDVVVAGKYAMINYWGRMRASDRAEALRLLKQVEADHLASRPWQVLSQGERQRVLIARALMAKPRLLILDEPCAGLDPVAREHFLRFLDRLGSSAGSPSLIFVTHHVEEIGPVFSHVLILKNGRVLAAGEKANVLRSKLLSEAFNAPITIRQFQRRHQLRIGAVSDSIV